MLTALLVLTVLLALVVFAAVTLAARAEAKAAALKREAEASWRDREIRDRASFLARSEAHLLAQDYAANWKPDPAAPRVYPKRTETAELRSGLSDNAEKLGGRTCQRGT